MDKLGDTVRVTAHEIDEKLSPIKTSLANFLKSGFSKLNSVIRFEQVANQTDDVVQTAVNTTSEVTVPDDPAVRMMIGKLLSTGLSLVVSIGLSYFLVKLLSNALDPTRKEKSAAQQKAAMMLQRLGVTDVKEKRTLSSFQTSPTTKRNVVAVKLQPAIIFVDEIDSFLRSRSSTDHEATAMIKTQFMSLWDGIITDPNCQIMIVGATNRPQDVDAAILRRMPCQFKIRKPAKEQRKHIMNIILEEEQVADIDLNKLGDLTDGFSGSDLKEGCRQAALYRVHEVLEAHRNLHGVDAFEIPTSDLRDMNMSDLEYGINQVKDSKELMAGSLSYPLLD
ncbi:ATAD1 [Mytilus coruscus]|uniref:ATAD1 n=1 Tax=Mytilus coruscus TaxID=42192 RepID=A0A6J7ZW48_MYTCO|nr:ATAD1 [Mytilus coruscus]